MTFLDRILQQKRVEVDSRRSTIPVERLKDRAYYGKKSRSLVYAIRNARMGIIAELKKASPSKGLLRENFDVSALAVAYEQGGARAISVLTDETFFQGSLDNLALTRSCVDLPLLRKDFIVDPYQLHEAKAYGADAVLLIVAALGDDELPMLMQEAAERDLEVLTEVHSEQEAERALNAGALLTGINNRNLMTFEVDLKTSERVSSVLPKSVTIVSESGIGSFRELLRLNAIGVHAALIGESFMRSPHPGIALQTLLREFEDHLK